MTTDLSRTVVSIVAILVLTAALVLSDFQPEVLALLSGALGWVLGFWFGGRASATPLK